MNNNCVRDFMLQDVKRECCCDCKNYDHVMHESNCWEKCDEFNTFLEDMIAEAESQTERE